MMTTSPAGDETWLAGRPEVADGLRQAPPGRWKTLPYQRGILDAITDPAVERVSAIGYFIHQGPCPVLVAQPTAEDAEEVCDPEQDSGPGARV